MRRSILTLPIVLALVVGVPELAWAGHKYRVSRTTKKIGNVEYRTYVMVGTIPPGHGATADQAVNARCAPPGREIRVVYVYQTSSGPQFYQSTIDKIEAGKFEVTINLRTSISGTYNVRIRCAADLPENTAPSSTANLVTIGGADPYTMFKTNIPPPSADVLAFTGRASVPLLLAGVVLLMLGGLLLWCGRRLAETG